MPLYTAEQIIDMIADADRETLRLITDQVTEDLNSYPLKEQKYIVNSIKHRRQYWDAQDKMGKKG